MSELKFNTTGQCMPPLVQTDQEFSYYKGIEGCGVQCHDPFFSEEERREISNYVLLGSTAAFLSNLFAVVRSSILSLIFQQFKVLFIRCIFRFRLHYF